MPVNFFFRKYKVHHPLCRSIVLFFHKIAFWATCPYCRGRGNWQNIYPGGKYPVIPSLGFTGEHRCQESKPFTTLHFVNLIVSQFIFASQILWRDLFWIKDTPILLVLFHKIRNRSKIFLKKCINGWCSGEKLLQASTTIWWKCLASRAFKNIFWHALKKSDRPQQLFSYYFCYLELSKSVNRTYDYYVQYSSHVPSKHLRWC